LWFVVVEESDSSAWLEVREDEEEDEKRTQAVKTTVFKAPRLYFVDERS
jgi:hypothetical protein